jgi:hypothetical protein
LSFADTGVERVRFSLLALKYVAKVGRIAPAKLLGYFSCPIGRIVVYYQDFPI